MVRSSLALAFALFSAACTTQSADAPEEQGDTQSTQNVAETKAAPVEAAPKACAPTAGSTRPEQVCWRWRCDGDAIKAASWNGSASSCSPSDLDAEAADRALRRINVHRFIADVPAVARESAWTPAAQECALIAHANGKLSHTPSKDWSCWSDVGAATSLASLVANRSAPASIAAYFEDPGNEPTMVHRRWLLDEKLTTIGLGSTDRYSCVVVDGKTLGGPAAAKATAGRGWAAWPPAGPVPFDVFTDEKIDTAGWTIQSTSDDLDAATVTVTEDGVARPVTVTHLTAGLGSRSALRFIPVGWTTEPGHSYVVKAAAIEFTVEPIDCDAG